MPAGLLVSPHEESWLYWREVDPSQPARQLRLPHLWLHNPVPGVIMGCIHLARPIPQGYSPTTPLAKEHAGLPAC